MLLPLLLKCLLIETNIWEYYVVADQTILSVEKNFVWWKQVFHYIIMEKRRQKSTTNVILVFIEAYGRLDKDELWNVELLIT